MLVEAAIATPLVVFLFLSVFEAGWLLKTHLSVEQMTSYSARVGAIAGSNADADELILAEIDRRAASSRRSIDRVVVYLAATADVEPSAACKSGPAPGVPGACTVYEQADFGVAAASLGCAWCPADRAPEELLGVWISYDHRSPTGLLGDRTLTDGFVLGIEHRAEIG